MKCDVCGEELEPGLYRTEQSGRIQFKDHRHRIRHAHMTSKVAAKTGAAARSNKELAAELAEALKQVLINEEDPKAEALGLLIDKLSVEASRDASGSFRALEASLSLIGTKPDKPDPPKAGQACVTCGVVKPVRLRLKRSSYDHLKQILERVDVNE